LLLDAAVAVFHERGFQKARVSDIVAAAGVAQGTFYLYFRSKENIFTEICDAFMGRLSLVFSRYAPGTFAGDEAGEIRRKVGTFIRGLITVYRENIVVAELLFREGAGQGGLFREIYEDIFIHFIALVRDQVAEGIAKGKLRFTDPETAAVFLFGVFERSMFYFTLIRGELDEERYEKQLTEFIFNGLGLQTDRE